MDIIVEKNKGSSMRLSTSSEKYCESLLHEFKNLKIYFYIRINSKKIYSIRNKYQINHLNQYSKTYFMVDLS